MHPIGNTMSQPSAKPNKIRHALAPKEGRILVCEGKEDVLLLNGILSHFAPDIYVVQAGGKRSVSLMAQLCRPAVYIVDRDFDLSPDEATITFNEQKPRTIWVRQDLEAYLI